MAEMFALADCDSFYCSCETAFRPALTNRPVIVLSNNDGNVIARNAAAKKLGITMAAPVHTLKALIQQHHIVVCSANFALYADMSSRVMAVLADFTPALEVYSIDEAFLNVTHLSALPASEQQECTEVIRATVRQWTGVPVSIGIGATKTLAKVANHAAKKLESGIFVFNQRHQEHQQKQTLDALLNALVVEEVWGIGHRRGAWLRQHGIRTALELQQADIAWLRKHLSVVVARTALELRGVSCLPLTTIRPQKQQVGVARAFGRDVTAYAELKEAIAYYAARACEKLRENGSLARHLTVYLTTNPFRKHTAQYSQSASVMLPRATAYTPDVVTQAHALLAKLYRTGYSYHKAGVLLGRLTTDAYEQLDLFASLAPLSDDSRQVQQREQEQQPGWEWEQERAVMDAVDMINRRFGHDTLRLAASGIERPWGMRQAHVSPRYTTQWNELVRAY